MIFRDADEAREHIAKLREQAGARLAAAQGAAARMTALRPSVWSPRREVRVELDASGLLQAVEFAEWAPQEPPASLGRALLKAHDLALREWQRQMDEIADEEYADQPEILAATKKAARDGMPARVLAEQDED